MDRGSLGDPDHRGLNRFKHPTTIRRCSLHLSMEVVQGEN
jgi:hypothetical protein